MPNYRATNKDTKEVVQYDEPSPRAEHMLEPWWLEVVFDSPAPPEGHPSTLPVPMEMPHMKVSRLEFLRKFDPAERRAIHAARQSSPELNDFMYLLEMADEVDLDNPDTVAGLALLEAAGLLQPGRGKVIRK